MKDKEVAELLAKFEAILAKVESHANATKQMHDQMKTMIEQNSMLQADMLVNQEDEIQQRLIKLASKAAKKAAKKSIAKAKIRDAFQNQELEG